jgi:divalent metal cation (Fe/Co/Zn/Cd) transporter
LSQLGNLFHHGYRNAQRLFHMLVGVIFMALAAGGAMVTFNEWMDYRKRPQEGVVELAIYAAFTIFLVILGLYSFVKARNVR